MRKQSPPFRFVRIGMALTKKQSTMKRKDTTTLRYLLLILAAAILNCLLDGTMNLIVTVCLCLALIPAVRSMDREAQKKE